MLKGFQRFIQEQGIVGIGVAFVLGAGVTKLVTAFVTAFVNPILIVITGATGSLATAKFTIGRASFPYGLFISALIDFIIIAFVIYAMVKVFRLDKIDKKELKK